MTQATLFGVVIPVSDPNQPVGSAYSSLVPANCHIILNLGESDTGFVTVNIAFTQNGNKNYFDYRVTSTVQSVNVPEGTTGIECNLQNGGGSVSAVFIQVWQTTE